MEEPGKRECSLKVPSQLMRMLVHKYTPCMWRGHFEQNMDSSSGIQEFSSLTFLGTFQRGRRYVF